jgi:hypothetical protein
MIYLGGIALAVILAVGFLVIPIAVFFGFEHPQPGGGI